MTTKAPRREVRLPPDTELALFRIVQEALTNAAKHSGCASVEIKLRYGEQVKLTVQDDGRGFSEPLGARTARTEDRLTTCASATSARRALRVVVPTRHAHSRELATAGGTQKAGHDNDVFCAHTMKPWGVTGCRRCSRRNRHPHRRAASAPAGTVSVCREDARRGGARKRIARARRDERRGSTTTVPGTHS